MNDCEACQTEMSALLDGEIEPTELTGALDHAMECEACRGFYLAARALDRALRPAEAGPSAGVASSAVTPLLPADVWEGIERAGRARATVSWREWSLRAAGLAVVALGLWTLGGLQSAPAPAPVRSYELSLEENRSGMTEARFVELTAELMRSDRRYHRAMFAVMRDVTSATRSEEASEDVVVGGSSAGPARSEDEPNGKLPG